MKSNKTWGGARPGSGRKKGGPSRATTVSLSPETDRELAKLREKYGIKLVDLVREAVRGKYRELFGDSFENQI